MAPVDLTGPIRENKIGKEHFKTGETVLFLHPTEGEWQFAALAEDPEPVGNTVTLRIMDTAPDGTPRTRTIEKVQPSLKHCKPLDLPDSVMVAGETYTPLLSPGPNGEELYDLHNSSSDEYIHALSRTALEGYLRGQVIDDFEHFKKLENVDSRVESLSRGIRAKLEALHVQLHEIKKRIEPLVAVRDRIPEKKLKEYVARTNILAEQFEIEVEAFKSALQEAEANHKKAGEKSKEREFDNEKFALVNELHTEAERQYEVVENRFAAESALWSDYEEKKAKYDAETNDTLKKAMKEPVKPGIDKPNVDTLPSKDDFILEKYAEKFDQLNVRVMADRKRPGRAPTTTRAEQAFVDRVNALRTKKADGTDYEPLSEMFKRESALRANEVVQEFLQLGPEAAEAAIDVDKEKAEILKIIKQLRTGSTESKETKETKEAKTDTGKEAAEKTEEAEKTVLPEDSEEAMELRKIEALVAGITPATEKADEKLTKVWDKLTKLQIKLAKKKINRAVHGELEAARENKRHEPIPTDVVFELINVTKGRSFYEVLRAAYQGGDVQQALADVFTADSEPDAKVLADLRRYGYTEWEDFVHFWKTKMIPNVAQSLTAWATARAKMFATRAAVDVVRDGSKLTAAFMKTGRYVANGVALGVGAVAGYGMTEPGTDPTVAAGVIAGGAVVTREVFSKIAHFVTSKFLSKRYEAKRQKKYTTERDDFERAFHSGFDMWHEVKKGDNTLDAETLQELSALVASTNRVVIATERGHVGEGADNRILLDALKGLSGDAKAIAFFEKLYLADAVTHKQLKGSDAAADPKALEIMRGSIKRMGIEAHTVPAAVVGTAAGMALAEKSSVSSRIYESLDEAISRIEKTDSNEIRAEVDRLKKIVAHVQDELGSIRRRAQGAGQYLDTSTNMAELMQAAQALRSYFRIPREMQAKEKLYNQLAYGENLVNLGRNAAKGKHGGEKKSKGGKKGDVQYYTSTEIARDIADMKTAYDALPMDTIAALLSDPILKMQLENVVHEVFMHQVRSEKAKQTPIEEVAARTIRGRTMLSSSGTVDIDSGGGSHGGHGGHGPSEEGLVLRDKKGSIDVRATVASASDAPPPPKEKKKSGVLGKVGRYAKGALLAAGIGALAYEGKQRLDTNDLKKLVETAHKEGWSAKRELNLLALNFLRDQVVSDINDGGDISIVTSEKASIMAANLYYALEQHKTKIDGVELPSDMHKVVAIHKDGTLHVQNAKRLNEIFKLLAGHVTLTEGASKEDINATNSEEYLKRFGLGRVQKLNTGQGGFGAPAGEMQPATFNYQDGKGKTFDLTVGAHISDNLGVKIVPGLDKKAQGVPYFAPTNPSSEAAPPPEPAAEIGGTPGTPKTEQEFHQMNQLEIKGLTSTLKEQLQKQFAGVDMAESSLMKMADLKAVTARLDTAVEHMEKAFFEHSVSKNDADEELYAMLVEFRKSNTKAVKDYLLKDVQPGDKKRALELFFMPSNVKIRTNGGAGLLYERPDGIKVFSYQPGRSIKFANNEVVIRSTETNEVVETLTMEDLGLAKSL